MVRKKDAQGGGGVLSAISSLIASVKHLEEREKGRVTIGSVEERRSYATQADRTLMTKVVTKVSLCLSLYLSVSPSVSHCLSERTIVCVHVL